MSVRSIKYLCKSRGGIKDLYEAGLPGVLIVDFIFVIFVNKDYILISCFLLEKTNYFKETAFFT